ncbi:YdcF family protein [Stanieria cyanosphaera]|nr:YdcF family protein [Stanieria cyanosphaera]
MKSWLFLSLVGITIIIIILGSIPVRLAIARYRFPQPQAILTLGGGRDREEFTANLAQTHPNLLIWVSTGSPNSVVRQIFREAGIAETRFYLDRRAVDTVTNFTSLVKDFQKHQIKHLYLITSDFHMSRARAIAFFVLGSHGITFTSISLPSKELPESRLVVMRDACRALLWMMTGYTGASFKVK